MTNATDVTASIRANVLRDRGGTAVSFAGTKCPKAAMFVETKDLGARILRFVASDETPDRDGDIIRAAGWRLGNYAKNPVFLWAHDARLPPIGRSVSQYIDGNKLVLDVQFAEAGVDYVDWPADVPSPETIMRLYKSNFMNAVSVGFMPGKWSRVEDPEERQRLGLGPWGILYEEQELLELSAVAIPSNPNALQLAITSGSLREEDAKYFTIYSPNDVYAVLCEVRDALTKHIADTQTKVKQANTPTVLATNVDELPNVQGALANEFKRLWGRMNKEEVMASFSDM